MISIAEAISDLLFVRDTVVVPGLGAFVKKPVSAKVNPVSSYFAKPTSQIEFDANLREDNDLVVRYISEKNEVSEEEARHQLALFVSDCFNSLKDGEKKALANIGNLYYDWAGDLAFEQEKEANYNADAFGLCDFSPEPVLRSETKGEIKAEIERQQKETNTPVVVDEKSGYQDDEDKHIEKRRSLVIKLTLLAAAAVFGLVYFNPFKIDNPERHVQVQVETPVIAEEPIQNQEDNNVIDTLTREQDSIARIGSEGTILIIAGCYDRDEYAQKLVNSLIKKDFQNAFMEKRGERWYVAYGRYRSEEEAVAVLQEIRESGKGKGWILK